MNGETIPIGRTHATQRSYGDESLTSKNLATEQSVCDLQGILKGKGGLKALEESRSQEAE